MLKINVVHKSSLFLHALNKLIGEYSKYSPLDFKNIPQKGLYTNRSFLPEIVGFAILDNDIQNAFFKPRDKKFD
jgi:hypothetical protein